MRALSPEWRAIAEDVRHYPSPHNSQPIKLRILDERRADVCYDLDLGLPAESYGIPFGHVCAGVFLEGLHAVAGGHGFRVEEALRPRELDFGAADRLHRIGTVTLVEREPDAPALARRELFLRRQTSRRPYDGSAVPGDAIQAAETIARGAGHTFGWTEDPAVVRDLVRINQSTLFSDLRDDAVYREIMTWLRFDRREAAERADGLSAEAMLLPGPILRFAMGHRGLWDAPVVGAAIRSIYLRTMRGVHQLGWLEGPFDSPRDYLEAGRAFLRLWLDFTARGLALHPLGTVITNPESHRRFVEAAGIREGGGRMAWMLFRFGRSTPPPVAHRRPADAMLVVEA